MLSTILVVDDSEVVLSVVRAVLEEAGYRVITQNRAGGSLTKIIQEKPALVLLDVQMPNLSGDVLARMCAKTSQTTGTRVVLHSSMSEEQLQRLVGECGAAGYIRKMDNSQALVRQVRRMLKDVPAGPSPGAAEPERRTGSSSHMRAAQAELQRPTGVSGRMRSPVETAEPSGQPFGAKGGASGVLLVDRDMEALSTMRDVIRGLGAQSDFALSLRQAIDKVRSEHPPRVIVVSAEMAADALSELLQAALLVDPTWGSRFLVTTAGSPASAFPRGFSGKIVKKPLNRVDFGEAIRSVLPS